MKDLLTFIFYVLAGNESARISEADANTDKWYEVITDKNGLTKVLQQSDTLAGIVYGFEQYMDDYRFDEINIALMENRKSPTCICRFFSDAWIYKAIHDYFRHLEKLEDMRFVGEITFQDDGSATFKNEYYASPLGEEAEIFIDEIAFCYFRNLICYISDLGDEDNPEDGCTYNDFLEIAEGNKDIARHLFDEVHWEHPSTLYIQWETHGTLDELEAMYKPVVYSYTGSGDFVHCNNCGKIMLLPTGADKCPSCYREGMLAWEDDSLHETTYHELVASEKYEVVVENKPTI
jgi:hypothetical protein